MIEEDEIEYQEIQSKTIEYVKSVGKISVLDLRKYVRTICSSYYLVGTVVTHITIRIINYGRETGIFYATSEGKHTIIHYKTNRRKYHVKTRREGIS